MKNYQVYSLNPAGAVVGDRRVEADDDDEAVFAARSMQRPLVTEIWDGDRRVARIPPYDKAGT